MKQQALTDGSGRWFYPEKCRKWERRYTNEEVYREIEGSDNGIQYLETLYFTEDSNFILSSCYTHPSADTEFKVINVDEATKWLITNGYHDVIAKLDLDIEAKRLKL